MYRIAIKKADGSWHVLARRYRDRERAAKFLHLFKEKGWVAEIREA